MIYTTKTKVNAAQDNSVTSQHSYTIEIQRLRRKWWLRRLLTWYEFHYESFTVVTYSQGYAVNILLWIRSSDIRWLRRKQFLGLCHNFDEAINTSPNSTFST